MVEMLGALHGKTKRLQWTNALEFTTMQEFVYSFSIAQVWACSLSPTSLDCCRCC
jgi:hypothetical protein